MSNVTRSNTFTSLSVSTPTMTLSTATRNRLTVKPSVFKRLLQTKLSVRTVAARTGISKSTVAVYRTKLNNNLFY